MKKIFFLVLVSVFILLISEAKSVLAGVSMFFDFQGVSETYVKFTYEFGSQFGSRAKRYYFLGEYKIQIVEGKAFIRYQDSMEEEIVIAVLINEEKSPFMWVKVKDLDKEERIREKAKEFSDKVFERLKMLEKIEELKRGRKTTTKNIEGSWGLFPRALLT